MGRGFRQQTKGFPELWDSDGAPPPGKQLVGEEQGGDEQAA